MEQLRVIVYHKQATSARTRFLRGSHLCLPDPLPALAVPLEEGEEGTATTVSAHPAPLLRRVTQWLGLGDGELALEREFRERVEVPGGEIVIHLARATTIDPPFDGAAQVGCRFVSLLEAKDLAAVELELLRRAYRFVMGG